MPGRPAPLPCDTPIDRSPPPADRKEHVGTGQLRRGHQALRGHHRGRRPLVGGPRRRAAGAARVLGLRQDDRAAAGGRPRGRDRGRRLHRRPRGQRSRPQGPRRGHGLPELRPLPALDGGKEHRVPAAPTRRREGRAADEGAARRRDARPGHAARPQAEPALGRPAPTGRAGPGHRARAARLPDGRAAVEPRRGAARADARRDRGAAVAAVDHDHLRHPRPGRGDDDGPPHRRDERGQAPAGGHARGPLRPAGQLLRRPFPRQSGNEPARGHPRRMRRRAG